MQVERYKSKCKIEADKFNTRPDIHPDDLIFQFVIDHPGFKSKEDQAVEYYFQTGYDSAQKLGSLLHKVCGYDGQQKIQLLEFASGYGCVTRHLKNVIPFAGITACDIHPQSGQFLKDKFGTDFVLSASRPEDLALPQTYDVVFALSFFSHMPKSSFSRWLRQLAACVKPGGFLIFTTHGDVSAKILPNGPVDEEGFSFVASSEQQDLDTAEYGLTVTQPKFVAAQIFKDQNNKLVYFHEAHWWEHQDVYVTQLLEGETRPATAADEAGVISQSQPLNKDQKIQALTAELAQIKSSTAWSLILVLWRMRVALFPHGSRRERAAQKLMHGLRTVRAKGFGIRAPSPEKKMAIKKNKTVRDLARGWDDEEYFKLILKSVTQPVIEGVKMPGFPDQKIQRQFVGSTDEHALGEGYTFYKYIKKYCESLGVPVNSNTNILDFGCGWGRISRFFFKDVKSNHFYGIDVDSDMISFCKAAMTCGKYAAVNPEPPTSFKSNSLDVIFAYSVFSHLSEPVALNWIKEFSRILKPNGILLATTQRKSFLDFCQSLRDQKEEPEFGWFKLLARSFIPIEKAKEDYDNGKFLYSAVAGGDQFRDRSFYGEALIPEKYIEQKYTPFLALREFHDDPMTLPQALFVMQKPT